MKSKQCVAGAIAVNRPAGMGTEMSSDICYDRLEHELLNLNQIALGYLELALSVGEPGERLIRVDQSLLGKSITAIRDSALLIDSFRKIRKAKAEEARQMPADGSAGS